MAERPERDEEYLLAVAVRKKSDRAKTEWVLIKGGKSRVALRKAKPDLITDEARRTLSLAEIVSQAHEAGTAGAGARRSAESSADRQSRYLDEWEVLDETAQWIHFSKNPVAGDPSAAPADVEPDDVENAQAAVACTTEGAYGSEVSAMQLGSELANDLRKGLRKQQEDMRSVRSDLSRLVSESEASDSELSRVLKDIKEQLQAVKSTVERRMSDLPEIRRAQTEQSEHLDRIDTSVSHVPVQLRDGNVEDRRFLVAALRGLSEQMRSSADGTVAATTAGFRAALPDLNRRYSDCQAVVVRLDQKLRRVVREFDLPADAVAAIEGQLDDHLVEARIRFDRVRGQYRDADNGTSLQD